MLANDLFRRCLMGRWDDGTRDVEAIFQMPKRFNRFSHATVSEICKCRENVVPLHCQ